MPSAYLNALHEEGTREDLLREVGKLYDENIALRSRVATAENARLDNERLRKLLARYRDETPLGHQPHMIAHEADEALGRS